MPGYLRERERSSAGGSAQYSTYGPCVVPCVSCTMLAAHPSEIALLLPATKPMAMSVSAGRVLYHAHAQSNTQAGGPGACAWLRACSLESSG